MPATITKLPKGKVEIAISVEAAEVRRELDEAAGHLSKERPIDGYRPGKAPYDIVKARYGEMTIYQHALEHIVRRHYVAAVTANDLQTYGQPEINVTKLVPGNPIEFTAVASLVPKVLSVPDIHSIRVVPKAVTVDDKAVDATLKDLQRMQTKESSVDREVREHDKVVVDMDLSADNVPLEGGQARDHGIYLDEEYYIPGLKEQVLGLKKGDKKTFKLRFPQTHYQKHLAGREVDFAVTVKDVLQLDHPALDDAFARTLGQENLAKIRELIRGNIKEEADEKEKQRTELEALDKLVEKSKFEEIPEIMIATEVDRMIGELRENLGKRGVEFPEYLTNIKKTEADLRVEFAPQAVKRVKTALVIREVGTKERIEVTDADVLSEVQKLMNAYSGNAEVQAQLRTDDYQAYLRSTLRNRKVVDLLRETATKQ